MRGAWKVARSRGQATLRITPLRPLSKRAAAAVTNEGARLLRFAATGDAHDVQIAPADGRT